MKFDVSNLKGNFAIASPIMLDDRFKEAIILLCDVKLINTYGFIVNQDEVLNKFKKNLKNTIFKDTKVYYGGPVAENRLFIIHSSDVQWSESLKITEEIYVTNFDDAIKKEKALPKNYLIVAGYTNWQGGQIEREIVMGFWNFLINENDLIFSNSKTRKWQSCMQKLNLNANTFYNHNGNS